MSRRTGSWEVEALADAKGVTVATAWQLWQEGWRFNMWTNTAIPPKHVGGKPYHFKGRKMGMKPFYRGHPSNRLALKYREKKYIDGKLDAQTPNSTTGVIASLTQAIEQGDGQGQRISDHIHLASLHFRVNLIINSAATTTIVRFVLLYDKAVAGTHPLLTDVYGSTGLKFEAYRNLNNSGRFNILMDKKFRLHTDARDVLMFTRNFNYVSKKKKLPQVKYLLDTDVEGANGPGTLYCMLVSSEGTNTPTVNVCYRIKYYD